MEELTKQQPGGAASYTDKLSKYLIVYVAILILAGLQFVIAYQHVDVGTMIFRMFAIAFLEAGLAVVFFMHLGSENRVFVTWVALVRKCRRWPTGVFARVFMERLTRLGISDGPGGRQNRGISERPSYVSPRNIQSVGRPNFNDKKTRISMLGAIFPLSIFERCPWVM
jgi:heme/copper-type cytochrome/quinol oxidase subunit 4